MGQSKTGLITRITPAGSWTAKSLRVYYAYAIVMDDGTTGQHSDSRYEDVAALPFDVGDFVSYLFKAEKYPKIEDIVKLAGEDAATPPPTAPLPTEPPQPKDIYPPKAAQYNRELNIVRESCIGSACNLRQGSATVTAGEILELARTFEDYVLNGKVPANTIEQPF